MQKQREQTSSVFIFFGALVFWECHPRRQELGKSEQFRACFAFFRAFILQIRHFSFHKEK